MTRGRHGAMQNGKFGATCPDPPDSAWCLTIRSPTHPRTVAYATHLFVRCTRQVPYPARGGLIIALAGREEVASNTSLSLHRMLPFVHIFSFSSASLRSVSFEGTGWVGPLSS
jgi:hypothetical protein